MFLRCSKFFGVFLQDFPRFRRSFLFARGFFVFLQVALESGFSGFPSLKKPPRSHRLAPGTAGFSSGARVHHKPQRRDGGARGCWARFFGFLRKLGPFFLNQKYLWRRHFFGFWQTLGPFSFGLFIFPRVLESDQIQALYVLLSHSWGTWGVVVAFDPAASLVYFLGTLRPSCNT